MTRPFLFLAAALMAGICCGNLFRISDLPVQISLLIALTLTLLSRIWIKRKQIHFYFLLLLSIFLLGILAMNLYIDPPIAENHILRFVGDKKPVSYTHLRAHETRHDLVCRLLLEKKKKKKPI